MAYTGLLDKTNAPLERLSLARVQIDVDQPTQVLMTMGHEALLYLLTGRMQVYANGACLGTLGGRRMVIEPLVQCVRFPAGIEFTVTLALAAFAADALWVMCQESDTEPRVLGNVAPYVHWNDTIFHTVGQGTHQRTVGEVPQVTGYALDVGETLNPPGGWSSYPPHADDVDLERFANGETAWEECFWIACEKPGIVNLKGIYTGKKVINKVHEVLNGAAYAMPLGSHAIVAHPDSYLYYFWAYHGTALEKIYRKYSTDIGTYRK